MARVPGTARGSWARLRFRAPEPTRGASSPERVGLAGRFRRARTIPATSGVRGGGGRPLAAQCAPTTAPQTRHDLRYGTRPGLLPACPGPEVQPLRIPGRSRRRAQRRREVVHRGVGLRGVGVVPDKLIDERPGRPSREGHGQPGLREARAGECILVQLPGAALVSAEERGAQLGGLCPCGQDRLQPRPVHHAAGSHQRESDGGPHQGDQLRRRAWQAVIVPVAARLEGRTVAAGARMLHHQRIDALPGGLERLGNSGHSGEDRGARPLQRPNNIGTGQPEGKTDQFHRISQQGVDLAVPVVVVVEPQRRDVHAVAQRIRPQPGTVVLKLRPHGRRWWQLRGIGNEDVHAEPCPRGTGAADLRLHGCHVLVARGQEPQPSGVVHGLHESRGGGPSGHRGSDDAGAKDVVRHAHSCA